MIKAINITKSYQKNVIFKNLNFSVLKGEIKAIVGPSGKGKSTLLGVLTGLKKVDFGTIIIDDKILVKDGKYAKNKEQREVLKDVGIVFQNFNLFLNLNVYKNLEIVKKDREKAENLLKRFSLYNKKDSLIKNLSGGEKQRLAIVRSLMLDPKIIFFDEPTSALDIDNVKNILKLILDLKEEGFTVVVVTHDLQFVDMLGCSVFKI